MKYWRPLTCYFSQWFLPFSPPFFPSFFPLPFFLPCFSKYLSSAYCRPGSVLGAGDITASKTAIVPHLQITEQAITTCCDEGRDRGNMKWMNVKPGSCRHVSQFSDDPHHIRFRSLTRFWATKWLMPLPEGFSSLDRAYKPKEQIARLWFMPSPVSASFAHICVSFVLQTAFGSCAIDECLWKPPPIMNLADDFLCVLITQNHHVHSGLHDLTQWQGDLWCSWWGGVGRQKGDMVMLLVAA